MSKAAAMTKGDPGGNPSPRATIQREAPLDRYMSVLEAVAAAPNLGLSDIGDMCQLPTATAHRLLLTLVRSRLLVATGTKRKVYALGPRLLRLLHFGSDEEWVHGLAQRTLDRVALEVGETCFL